MTIDERGRDRSAARRVLRAVSVLALGAALLASWYGASSTVIVVLLVLAGVTGIASTRRNRQAGSERLEQFEEWARTRGLVVDPLPLPGLDRLIDPGRPVLLQETALSVICAATTGAGSGRLTVMEWEYSTGSSSGRLLRMAGFVLTVPPIGSHLLLRPVGRFRLPHIPGTPQEWLSGHDELDDRYVVTLESGPAPVWLDGALAAELVAAGREGASIEIKDDIVLVARVRSGDEDWDSLLADGRRVAAAFGRVLG